MLGKLGRRSVLRTGYAAVIAVLILSALEAYRIQINVSRQHIDIFYRYVDQEEALTTLRRNLWLAGNYVRDFFIHPTAAQADELAAQLRTLEDEDGQVLDHLTRAFPENAAFAGLKKNLAEFWSLVDPVPKTMLHSTDEQQIEFIQRVIVPRRGELYDALRAFSSADERRVQDSSQQIINARHDAAQRLLLMLGLGVFLSVLVALVSIRHAEHLEQRAQTHYAAVEEARAELQRLSARLLEVEEEGRRRLARELHDEIGQSLALLQIEISHAQAAAQSESAVVRERLQRARAMAEETVQTIRDISVLLRPTLLDDLGLVPALQFQIEHFQRRSGIACEFVEENVADQFSDATKTCVYRVVQEALHNCEKHAGATKVQVSVRQLSSVLLVEVEDQGCGFQLNDKGMPSRTTGLGLLGMRERAAIAGGSLIIDSSPGRGTRVALRLPVPATAHAVSPSASEKVTA